ncbi:MAG: NAD(P)-dependent oxidoreductase [Albidovulum sp.]
MRIGFLGTGLMGAPMIRRLAAAGHDLHIWNRSPDRAMALGGVAKVCATATEAARGADILIAMLLDGPVSRQVLDRDGVIAVMAEGALIINMASVEPITDMALAALAAAKGVGYLDAPVSGGVAGAEAGTLAILVGGAEADFARAEPVLKAMGRPTRIGESGAGQAAKLANQVIVGATIAAVAEAFRLAEAAGCDLGLLREALRGGFADSRILDLHGKRMVEGNFVPGGRAALQLKDLDNALALAAEKGLNMPVSRTAREGYAGLVALPGGADLDHAAYFLWLAEGARR